MNLRGATTGIYLEDASESVLNTTCNYDQRLVMLNGRSMALRYISRPFHRPLLPCVRVLKLRQGRFLKLLKTGNPSPLAAALKVEKLHYAYGKHTALDSISLAVPQGAFCALLGLNGAGKSTLFAVLSGLLVSSDAGVFVNGIDLSAKPRLALGQMGIVFQETTLDLDLSVRRNLQYFASLQGMSSKTAAIAIDRAMDRLEIRDRASDRARDLNGGHRRRVEIARALLHSPKIVLLDEPTVGLDPASRAAITDHVHALCAEEGISVLWATHLVDEVWPEDNLVILHKGKVLYDGLAKTLGNDGSMSETFLDMTAATA